MGNKFLRFTILFSFLMTASPAIAKDSSSEKKDNSSSSQQAKGHDHHEDLKRWWNSLRRIASSGNTVPAGMCAIGFETRVPATKIKGNHIYLDVNALDFLKNENGFFLQEVDLELTLQGKHQSTATITVSLNGLKVSQRGNSRYFDFLDYSKPKDQSRLKAHLQHLLVNGAESFDHYLLRLKKNKGLLKISVHAKSNHIADATVIFKGSLYKPCGNPQSTTTTTTTSSTTTSTSTTTITLPSTSTTTTLPGSTTTTTLPVSASTTTTTTSSTTTSSTTTVPTTTTTTLPPEDLTKYQVRLDSKAPATSPTSSATMLIYFSSENTDGTFWCSIDSAVFEKCQSPLTLADLETGVHSFQVFAKTPSGVTAGNPTNYQWKVDRIAPVASITNVDSLPSLTNQSTLTFQFASTKSGTFKCSVDGSASSTCTSPMTATLLNEGLHTFSVIAVDTVGNISGTAANYQWTLDLTPPTTSILAVEPAGDLTSSSQKRFTFAASETSNFLCSVDRADFKVCESPVSVSNLTEGNHWFEVRATDLAGNMGAIISSDWTTDYTAPQLTLGPLTPAAGLTNAQSASVEFSTNEPSTTVCQWDDSAPVLCESPFLSAFQNDGIHQLTVIAKDRVGLSSNPIIIQWNSDSTAPVLSFNQMLPSTETNLNSSNFSASFNSSEEMSLSATLNGVAIEPLTNPIVLQNLTEGNYTLQVSGFDSAGNFSNAITHGFVVDLTAPTVTITSNGAGLSNLDSRSFEFSASETVSYRCSLDEAGYETCESPVNYSGLADGDHTLAVIATDMAGNTKSQSASWTVDTTAPQTLEAHNQISSSITFSFSSSENGATFVCSIDGQVFSSCSSPLSFTNLDVGSHPFTVKAIDAAGNMDPVGASYTIQVLAPIQTSLTSSSPAGNLVSASSMSISFSANQNASGFICSLDGGAFQSCSSPASYSGLSQGAHSFVVKAIDIYGTADTTGASKNWTVDSVAPTVTSLSSTTNTNSITLTWFTNEPTTAKVSYGVGTTRNQATAENMTLTTSHTIQITGLSSNTLYSVQVSGRDAAGNPYTGTVLSIRTNR
jgi:hypothetical protein